MRQFRRLLSCATLCMLAILLHLAVLSSHTGGGAAAGAATVEVTQVQGGFGYSMDNRDVQDFKPPKHSFVDYTDFLLTSSIQPPATLTVARRVGIEVSDSPPDVYPDIFIPPEPLA